VSTSTRAATRWSGSTNAATRPSPVTRSGRLMPPFLRRMSTAFGTSPPASVRALLHSIIPRPVSLRSSLTAGALGWLVGPSSFQLSRLAKIRSQRAAGRSASPAAGWRLRADGLLYDRRSGLGVRRRAGAVAGGGCGTRLDQPLLVGRQGRPALHDGVGQLRQD